MDFLTTDIVGTPTWVWLAFIALVTLLTAFDLGVLHRTDRVMGVRESLLLSAGYISIALIFGLWVWTFKGPELGLAYYTGFLIEKALSIDNIFVISLIFTYFAIPARFQYRALLWGILAVIVLRGLMIAAGAALVQNFYWVLYIFAAFLIATGVKMLFSIDHQPDIANNPPVRFLSKKLRVTHDLHNEKFFVRVPSNKPGARPGTLVWSATPLFLALVVINLADLVFAIDSVPAIFAITTDTYVVYTSNIMAILGLRALYFALAAMIDRFVYLKYALALVLVFIGAKIFIGDFLIGSGKVPPLLSLGVTVTLIAGGILASLWRTRNQTPEPGTH